MPLTQPRLCWTSEVWTAKLFCRTKPAIQGMSQVILSQLVLVTFQWWCNHCVLLMAGVKDSLHNNFPCKSVHIIIVMPHGALWFYYPINIQRSKTKILWKSSQNVAAASLHVVRDIFFLKNWKARKVTDSKWQAIKITQSPSYLLMKKYRTQRSPV